MVLHVEARPPLAGGGAFPDLALPDHAGNAQTLSELVAGDPAVLQFYRGWWCPKEQAFFRRLLALQDKAEVASCRIVSVSVDPPPVTAAFRAGLGARWTFLCDHDRTDLGSVPAPAGPTIERYGSAQPWPWDRFAAA